MKEITVQHKISQRNKLNYEKIGKKTNTSFPEKIIDKSVIIHLNEINVKNN